MLLRKHLEGARLATIVQQGLDRILHLEFHGAEGETTLIAELMGKHSNVVLVDREPLVLGALKHVRAEENRFRVTLPRHLYVNPPRPMQPSPHQDRPKLDPLHAIAGDLAAGLAGLDGGVLLWKALLDLLDGLSPTLAREAAFVVTGAMDTLLDGYRDLTSAHGMLTVVRERFSSDRGQPSAVWNGRKLVEYAAFPLRQHGVEPTLYPDIAALLELAYAPREGVDALAGPRGPLLKAIEAGRQTQRRKIASLESALISEQDLAELRTRGEMVMAYQHSIEPEQRALIISELSLTIAIDPTQTPLENAQRLFKRYEKARDATRVVPELLEAARQELAYLDQLAVHAEQATDPGSLAAVREELRELSVTPEQARATAKKAQKKGRAPQGKGGKPKAGVTPFRVRADDGTEILVGRSARQNEAVTFTLAGQQDLWLHARQIPGAHVILRTGGRAPSNATLERAAGLAAYHSQARGATTVPVDCTPVRNVRHIKGGKPGLVTYSGETTLNVRPAG